MARPGTDGPFSVYRRNFDQAALARLESRGIRWVEDPGLADAVLDCGPVSNRLAPLVHLSAREEEILGYLADGWSNDEIADRLKISPATVKFHLAGMYRKFGVNRRSEAVREGLRMGMIEI